MKHFTEAAKDLNVSLCAKTSWHEQPQNRASLSAAVDLSPAKEEHGTKLCRIATAKPLHVLVACMPNVCPNLCLGTCTCMSKILHLCMSRGHAAAGAEIPRKS